MKPPFLSIVSLALALLGAVGGYLWWYGVVALESTRAAELSSQIASAKNAAVRLQATEAALADLASTEAAVQDYFVSDATIVDFLSALEAIGRRAGTKVEVRSVAADSSLRTLSVDLVFSGSFASVMRATGAIEYAPYDLVDQGFDITKASDRGDAWTADLNLSVGEAVRPASTTPAAQP